MTQTYDSFLLYHCFGQRPDDGPPGYDNEGPVLRLSCCYGLSAAGSLLDMETLPLSEGHSLQRQRRVNLPHDRRHTVVHPVDVDGCQLSEAMASEASPVSTQQDVLHVEGHPEQRDLRAVWNSSEFVPVGES